MATPFTDTPKIGVDLVGYIPAADLASGAQDSYAALGSQVLGSDGRLYVYARANASIAASDTDCSVSSTTFLATASGGSYRSPAFALATGDEAWFSKASV
jgi:hypothetical protein